MCFVCIHQCIVSCHAYVCLCHVLVCAGSVLVSVLQFLTVLVQQAIAGITIEVLFEVRRHQHISTFTNLRMLIRIHLYSWYFLIFPLFSSFSLAYVFVSLFCSFLSSCPSSVALSLLFSTLSLPSSPLPPSLITPCHSAPYWLHLPPQRGLTAAVTGHYSCWTGGPQTSISHHCI